MGLRFRKSVSAGPFRLNFSKSGIGYSVGTKGYRVTKTANGRIRKTASIPGTGISYVTENSTKRQKISKTKEDNDINQTPDNENVTSDNGGSNNDQNNNRNKRNKKNKDVDTKKSANFLAILLLFIFPPIGIYWLWKRTNWKKNTKIILTVIFALYLIPYTAGFIESTTEQQITSIEITNLNKELDINQSEVIEYKINPEDAEFKNYTLDSSDKNIAYLELEGSTLYLKTKNEGKATVWIEQDGVKSNIVNVNVVDKAKQKKIEEEKKQAELKKKQEEEKARLEEQRKKEEQEKKEAEEQARIQEEQQKTAEQEAAQSTPAINSGNSDSQNSSNNTVLTPPPAEPTTGMVWISETGSKYHTIPNCGRMNPNKASQVTVSEAQNMGLEPCSKCF